MSASSMKTGGLCILACVCGADQSTDQKLIMLPQATAKCSDGSPIGYFFRPAPADGQKNKITVWLKGGAMCVDYKDCVTRQSENLGSSKYWLKTHEGVSIQSTNKTLNPDFYDWNHVYIEYCSGDFWSGTSAEPINPFPEGGEKKFVFAGQLILSEVLDHLSDNGHHTSEDFIFTGGSAGGIGAINNADWLAARFLSSATKYRVMPQGGFFGSPLLDYKSFVQNKTNPDPDQWVPWLKNISRYISSAEKKCIVDNPSLPNACASPFRNYPYTTAPMFLVQAAVDFEQVFEFSGAPKKVVYTNPSVAAYTEYSHGVQAGGLRRAVVQGRKTATDGLFAPACLGHTTSQMGWLGTTRVPAGGDGQGHPKPQRRPGTNPKVDGMWAQQAFSDWYFGRGGNHMHLDENANLTVLCSCNTVICGPKPIF